MRILVLNQYYHPDQSSTAQILTELCEDLAADHDVTVVAGRPSYNPVERAAPRRELLHGVRVVRSRSTSFHRTSMPGRLANYGTYVGSCLADALSLGRPDVVLAMTDPPVVASAAAAVSAVRGIPFVYVNQDLFPQVAVALGRLHNPAVVASLRRLNRTIRARSTRIVAIGRDMARRLIDEGAPAEKIHFIPNWADGRTIRPLERPSTFRRANGWDRKFVVMHSGNVGLSQDLGTLLRTAELLRDAPEVVVAVVGDGAARPELQARADRLGLDNVTFLPYQPKADLSDSLGAADVHLVSLRPGLAGAIVPSKVYGIMAAGKPFLASVEPDSEPAVLAAEHRCGVRVDPAGPRAMAEAILSMRAMPLGDMGIRGRRAFEERYDRPIATASYRRLLEEVASVGPYPCR